MPIGSRRIDPNLRSVAAESVANVDDRRQIPSTVLVRVPVMNVRIVRVRVHHRLVPVRMRVRTRVAHGRIVRTMGVPVMLVVDVRMRVVHRFVRVLVGVPLGDVEPHAGRHQRTANHQSERQRIAPQHE